MRCLVTGGAGFIGSHLCEMLQAQGHEVESWDNFETGHETNLRCPNKHYDISRHPFNNMRIKVDWVFHLAARAEIIASIKHPWRYHLVNVHGTVKLLELCRRSNVSRFVYAASGSCYGANPATPTPETAPLQPVYPYSLTKMLGEQYVLHYAKVFGLSALSMRLGNVYGPRARTTGGYGAVFGTFLAQIANDAPITIIGDGSQKRDFVWVKDVCRALICAAESRVSGEAFNVASGEPHSINELAKRLGSCRQVYIPKRPGEPDSTALDIRKIKEQLGWEPQMSFAKGCEEMRSQLSLFKNAPLWTPAAIEQETKPWFEALGRQL